VPSGLGRYGFANLPEGNTIDNPEWTYRSLIVCQSGAVLSRNEETKQIVRTTTLNSHTLEFTSQGFEEYEYLVVHESTTPKPKMTTYSAKTVSWHILLYFLLYIPPDLWYR
jgi:hypothetical protein